MKERMSQLYSPFAKKENQTGETDLCFHGEKHSAVNIILSLRITEPTKESSVRYSPLNLHLTRQGDLINPGTNTYEKPGFINSSPCKIIYFFFFLHMTVSQECHENTLSHRDPPHTQKIIILHGKGTSVASLIIKSERQQGRRTCYNLR